MIRLLLAAVRALLGRLGAGVLVLWILLAAFLATGGGGPLGPTPLGDYLGLLSLFPALLLFRVAALAEQRRRQGWPTEELLRDPGCWRLPLAEAGAGLSILAGGLLLAALPAAAARFRHAAEGSVASTRQPVLIQTDSLGWTFRFPAPVPEDSCLTLLFLWDETEKQPLTLVSSEGSRTELRPGKIARLPLQASEARRGEVQIPPLPGVRPAREFARLEIPVPGTAALPLLLWGQALFFAPLLALALALARRGVRAGIAALGALALGGLAAWRPLPARGPASAPLEHLARTVEALSHLFPPVDGLLATGSGFEARFRTTPLWATLLWLLLGGLCLGLARNRPQRL